MNYSTILINENFKNFKNSINECLENFQSNKYKIIKNERNILKIVNIEGKKLVIKSFKIPNFINKVIYTFFRKSKARRSYEYANKLVTHNINTPKPVAYYETKKYFLLTKSYYICEYIDYDFTFKDFIKNKFEFKLITKLFAEFTYSIHEKNINFLDNTPGNTLIVKQNNSFDFYLVDLNRMKFERMTFKRRMKNLSKLTTDLELIKAISTEYSKKTNINENIIYDEIISYTEKFQNFLKRKKEIKNKLGIG